MAILAIMAVGAVLSRFVCPDVLVGIQFVSDTKACLTYQKGLFWQKTIFHDFRNNPDLALQLLLGNATRLSGLPNVEKVNQYGHTVVKISTVDRDLRTSPYAEIWLTADDSHVDHVNYLGPLTCHPLWAPSPMFSSVIAILVAIGNLVWFFRLGHKDSQQTC